ncbi:MAG: hypothetical protein ABIH90_03170, partial [Candidatus Aenigmatarchaeota archaeon]
MTLTLLPGLVLAVQVGEVGVGATPGDQLPRICVYDRDVIIGTQASPPGINPFDYRTSLYAFMGEQIKFIAVARDTNGVMDIGFMKAFVGTSPELICSPIADPHADIVTETLCYKSDATGWSCGTNTDPDYANAAGTVTYIDRGDTLEATVELSGLKPNTQYQLTLQGRDGNDGNTALGNNCANPNAPADGYTCTWECGFGAGGTGNEGFWNFDLKAMTDANGDYTYTYDLGMPVGHYGIGPAHDFGFGLIVKEILSDDSCVWTDYVPVLMESTGLDWNILPEGSITIPQCDGFGETNFDTTDKAFSCLVTVESGWYGDGEVTLLAGNSGELTTQATHTENWFFNPAISLDVTTSDGSPISFEPLPYGADTPSERTVYSVNKIKIKNMAEGGVNLWMFIAGTNLVDPSGASMCPITNYIDIEENMQYRGWTGTQWQGGEGWNAMNLYNTNDGCNVYGTCY